MKSYRLNRSGFVFCFVIGIIFLANPNPAWTAESQLPVIINTIPLPVIGGGVAISSTADRIIALVADLYDDQLIPVDLETHIVLESISFGLNGTNVVPNVSTTLDGQLAVAPVYDFSSGFFGIGVVDVNSLSPVGELIPEPGFPRGVSITPDGSKALVVNQNIDYITIIDLQASPPVVSGQITLPNPLAPAAIDIAPDGQTAVVSDALRTVVYIIDVHSQTVTYTINLPSLAQNNLSVEITPDSSRALLGMDIGGNPSLGIVDLTNSPPNLEFEIPVDASFQDISVTPDGTTALLSLGGNTGDTPKITIVDLTSSPPAVTGTIPLESVPTGVEVTTDGSLAVVVLSGLLVNTPGNLPPKLLILNLKPTIPDADGDGIPDDVDACPSSDLSGTVIIDGCDSGVDNVLFDDGCTILDLIWQCAEDAKNHGQFDSGVAHILKDLKKDGTISGEDKGEIQTCAEGADIP